jgi:hypothetical protein
VMEIPLRITDYRTKPNLQKLLFGLFCQVLSTRSSISTRVSDRSGIAPSGCDGKARSWSAVLVRPIVGKLGSPSSTLPARLPLVTW